MSVSELAAAEEAPVKPSRLRLLPNTACPPDRFRYTFAQDGHRIVSFDRDSWLRDIRQHYIQNDYPLPDDWREQAEDQLCRLLPPEGWCAQDDGGEPTGLIRSRFDMGDAIRGTTVLLEFVKQGCPIVPQAVAEQRASTCSTCYALLDIPGCGACHSVSNLVADACGARTTKADGVLGDKVCGVCHCSARANVWIPVEVSKRGVTDEMRAAFPSWCWKKREIEALPA